MTTYAHIRPGLGNKGLQPNIWPRQQFHVTTHDGYDAQRWPAGATADLGPLP